MKRGAEECRSGPAGQKIFSDIMDFHRNDIFPGMHKAGKVIAGKSAVAGHACQLGTGAAFAVDPDLVSGFGGNVEPDFPGSFIRQCEFFPEDQIPIRRFRFARTPDESCIFLQKGRIHRQLLIVIFDWTILYRETAGFQAVFLRNVQKDRPAAAYFPAAALSRARSLGHSSRER